MLNFHLKFVQTDRRTDRKTDLSIWGHKNKDSTVPTRYKTILISIPKNSSKLKELAEDNFKLDENDK